VAPAMAARCFRTKTTTDHRIFPVNYDTLFARHVRAHFESGITCSIGPAQHPIFVSASVGFALYPDDGTTSSDLFRSADKSMYAHKRGASVA
jgi:GGDEF domain-containing protein